MVAGRRAGIIVSNSSRGTSRVASIPPPGAHPLFALASAASADDTRNIFRFEKGSYEKTGDKNWVEKRGDDTFELKETRLAKDVIQLEDAARKLIVYLGEKEATVRKVGNPTPERLPGEWVQADVKPADPKAVQGDKVVWKNLGGTYEKVGEGKWVEKKSGETFELMERVDEKESVTLFDKTRELTITFLEKSANVYRKGQKEPYQRLKGEWVKAEVKPADPKKPDLDPKADGRTVWMAIDVTFELTAPGVWTETTGSQFKTVMKFIQKAVTEEYVELVDEEYKARWVRLTATARLERLTELNKYKAEGKPGGWQIPRDGQARPGAGRGGVRHLAGRQVGGPTAGETARRRVRGGGCVLRQSGAGVEGRCEWHHRGGLERRRPVFRRVRYGRDRRRRQVVEGGGAGCRHLGGESDVRVDRVQRSDRAVGRRLTGGVRERRTGENRRSRVRRGDEERGVRQIAPGGDAPVGGRQHGRRWCGEGRVRVIRRGHRQGEGELPRQGQVRHVGRRRDGRRVRLHRPVRDDSERVGGEGQNPENDQDQAVPGGGGRRCSWTTPGTSRWPGTRSPNRKGTW